MIPTAEAEIAKSEEVARKPLSRRMFVGAAALAGAGAFWRAGRKSNSTDTAGATRRPEGQQRERSGAREQGITPK